jgi:hypothetical protein
MLVPLFPNLCKGTVCDVFDELLKPWLVKRSQAKAYRNPHYVAHGRR